MALKNNQKNQQGGEETCPFFLRRCQDEMRVGQKNKLTYRWASHALAPLMINAPNRPTCLVQSAQRA
jgi:hypothetical protein